MKRARNARSDVGRLARYARLAITIIGGLLALLFTWLQLKDIPFADVVQSTKPELVQRFTLVFYYLCWIAGSRFDVNIQEAAYVDDPQRGRFGLETIAIITFFGIVAVALLWASGDEKRFATILTIFVIANVIGWRHIVKRVRPAINSTRKRYRSEHDYFGLEQLQAVVDYMTGRWQWRRFAVLLSIIFVSDIIILAPPVRQQVAQLIQLITSRLPGATIDALVPEILLLIFVLVSESWMWIMRIRVATVLTVIGTLNRRYELILRRSHSSRPSSPEGSA